MSWFTEWWEKFKPQIDPDTYNGDEDKIREAIARCTYKAALEKAVDNLEQYVEEWDLSDLDEIKEQINEQE